MTSTWDYLVRVVTDMLSHSSHFKTLRGTKPGTETLFLCCRKEMQPILAVWGDFCLFLFCFFYNV